MIRVGLLREPVSSTPGRQMTIALLPNLHYYGAHHGSISVHLNSWTGVYMTDLVLAPCRSHVLRLLTRCCVASSFGPLARYLGKLDF